ncbi:MAG: hypothetical protein M1305_03720, partial [Candidatus Marsarchaeota archaeon]|nr:hypothetical protein [Candidatus Marsarchaeota archaeon]
PTGIADAVHLKPLCLGEASGSSRSRTLRSCRYFNIASALLRLECPPPSPASSWHLSAPLNPNKLPVLRYWWPASNPLEEPHKQLLLCQGERAFIFYLCDLSWSFACLIEVVGNDVSGVGMKWPIECWH